MSKNCGVNREVNIFNAQGPEEEEGSEEGEVHPGVVVDSGVGEVEEVDSGEEGVEGVSEEGEGVEDLKNFILPCFGIHIASADFNFFFSTPRSNMERRTNKKKLSRNLLDMKVSV